MDVKGFWRAVLEQDAPAIRGYFHENACINWHCTNECFTVEEFIRANCEYPGEWDGEVERVEVMGDLIVTATRVYTRDKTAFFHAVSFIRVREDKILSMDEYWGDDGPAPQWRQEKKTGEAIRSG